MKLDQITNEDIKKIYPTGVYYLCAASVYKGGKPSIESVSNSKHIIGIQSCKSMVYGEQGKGCLYYKGTWAPICDSEGNILHEKEKEPNYEIY